MIKVYIKDINEYIDQNNYPDFLFKRSNKYQTTNEKKQSNLAYMMLYDGLKNDYNLKVKENDLDFDKFMIQNKLFFSITHRLNLTVVAISSSNIGIDILEKDAFFGKLHLNKKILSSKEKEEYLSIYNKEEYLLKVFTKKEAYSKFMKTGLNQSIYDLDITNNFNYYDLHDLNNNEYILCIYKESADNAFF